jgi:hypothetical protein
LGLPGQRRARHRRPLGTQRRPPRLEDEIIILRDAAAAPAPLLAKVVDQLLGPLASRPRLDLPPARRGPGWLLVLEGWVSSSLEGRGFGHRIALQVNPLSSTPGDT